MTPRKRGFTLVELNISMAFVAMLLLGIAALSLHVARLYERGMLLKDVNYIGREVMSQMRRDIAAADPSQQLIYEMKTADGQVENGRICLGSVSYVYNSVLGISKDDEDRLITQGGEPVALVRITDTNRSWCTPTAEGSIPVEISSDSFDGGDASELIERDEFATISVHHIDINLLRAPGTPERLALYNLDVRLGTSNTNAIDLSTGTCLPPSVSTIDFNTCYVVDYATIIRAGGLRL